MGEAMKEPTRAYTTAQRMVESLEEQLRTLEEMYGAGALYLQRYGQSIHLTISKEALLDSVRSALVAELNVWKRMDIPGGTYEVFKDTTEGLYLVWNFETEVAEWSEDICKATPAVLFPERIRSDADSFELVGKLRRVQAVISFTVSPA
jgi:hypothetical protein